MNETPIVVSFTGHRNYTNAQNDRLRESIISLYNIGARVFRVGMAEGFDMAAAELVMEMMVEDINIVLEAYIPWPDFDKHLNHNDSMRYNNILKCCNAVHYASNEYNRGVYHKRNDMLIEGADYIVAWWDGSSSGTGYTVKQAKRHHLKIINLYPSPQMTLQL
ncbi:MAG: DUF1273 family protein [Alistipes sp.]|nr:DUF1273 family protein [Alistipes sp.]